MEPQIDDSRLSSPLSNEIKHVLRVMFADYQQVILRTEFTEGLSSSRVFEVRPIQSEGAELPSVVKVDEVQAIHQEWIAYKRCIRHKLPTTAIIRGQPVYPPDSVLGGLWYSLAGEGVYQVVSLADYMRQNRFDKVEPVLKRLFKSMDALWNQKDVATELHLQSAYDSALPVNLTIDVGELLSGQKAHWLHPTSIRGRAWQVGDYVQVAGFQVEEISRSKQRLTLNIPTPPLFRLYLQSVSDIQQYEVGQTLETSISGKVVETRKSLLIGEVQKILGASITANIDSLTLSDGTQLPNPLAAMPSILRHSFDANVACIHGDLHMKNILVEPESGNIFLIDFAKSRPDHVLRDLIHLEMSVLTDLVVPQLPTTNIAPQALFAFYTQMYCAVHHNGSVSVPEQLATPFAMLSLLRRTARNYLFKSDSWAEYYNGLTLYLLGALRHESFSHLAKQALFLGAAVTLKLLQAPPDCHPIVDENKGEKERYYPPGDKSGKDAQVARPQQKEKYHVEIHNAQGVVIGDRPQVIQNFGPAAQPVKGNAAFAEKLQQLLLKHFEMEELHTLCFSLRIEYDDLRDEGQAAKARELVRLLQRDGRLNDLYEAIKWMRPNVD